MYKLIPFLVLSLCWSNAQGESFAESVRKKILSEFKDEPELSATVGTIKDYSSNNHEFLTEVTSLSCASVGKIKKPLKGMYVTYENGDDELFFPVSTSQEGTKTRIYYVRQLPGWARDAKVESRLVSTRGNKLIWTGTDGKEYPIKKIQGTTGEKFLDGDKEDSYEDKLCKFRSKSRHYLEDLDRATTRDTVRVN